MLLRPGSHQICRNDIRKHTGGNCVTVSVQMPAECRSRAKAVRRFVLTPPQIIRCRRQVDERNIVFLGSGRKRRKIIGVSIVDKISRRSGRSRRVIEYDDALSVRVCADIGKQFFIYGADCFGRFGLRYVSFGGKRGCILWQKQSQHSVMDLQIKQPEQRKPLQIKQGA